MELGASAAEGHGAGGEDEGGRGEEDGHGRDERRALGAARREPTCDVVGRAEAGQRLLLAVRGGRLAQVILDLREHAPAEERVAAELAPEGCEVVVERAHAAPSSTAATARASRSHSVRSRSSASRPFFVSW